MNCYRNQDGTYNGVAFIAAMTGLSEAEIAWTAKRMQVLMRDEKKTKDEAKAIVLEEGKAKPWEQEQ